MTDAAGGDAGDLLCVILDLNPLAWSLSSVADPQTHDQLSLEQALDQVLIFANAHLALRHENQIAVFGAGYSMSKMLYSSSLAPSAAPSVGPVSSARDANTYQQFRIVNEGSSNAVRDMMAEQSDDNVGKGGQRRSQPMSAWSAPSQWCCVFSSVLTDVNRLNSASTLTPNLNKPRPRILVLSVTDDASTQYVSTMNCIFTAQKNSIPIDVCKIFGRDAVFLQQACHLTGGSYFKIAQRRGLLQYLIMTFLPGPSARKHLNQPTQDQVDLRAACFCHRKIVDVGYVCSVCLSIFCAPVPVCATCRTKFPMATLKRFGFGARPANSGAIARSKKRKAPANGETLPPVSAGV
ncbi:BZ3500_MvSof-1268-A1-R1_Chr12-3g03995 [Microbotryum saponariae]|uniref:General transcription and DNA repair factor IIH subunit TFB4 n=1 Tax=Microbotryum saponariae TaxID=289078 RepID=A0A2X0M0N3_9BASI|nr:BZ3500_MvSof-1268-A1-R1_Chr12-3g03995 [Microbotryum saponariae]SDA05383.1 BZ3501_MvSof-1269-A2-R1_Chr12-1g03367 [Microbotryum saponariae]